MKTWTSTKARRHVDAIAKRQANPPHSGDTSAWTHEQWDQVSAHDAAVKKDATDAMCDVQLLSRLDARRVFRLVRIAALHGMPAHKIGYQAERAADYLDELEQAKKGSK